MKIDNYIHAQHLELKANERLNPEYLELYEAVKNQKLKEIFSSLHKEFEVLFKSMNSRLPTGENTTHFWANESRRLISSIEMAMGLYKVLKKSADEFQIDTYYYELFNRCQTFLSGSGGSTIPPNMEKIDLYYTAPIFTMATSLKISKKDIEYHFPLKLIGEGAYAHIYKYRDDFYNKNFALKRAKKDLTEKEQERFKREFEEMKALSSPYIVEVYSFEETQSQYIMEFMDFSLDTYIQQNNSKISVELRRNIAFQILKAFSYLQSKKLDHRDISPKNILLKQYEDTIVVKISDFGLVKTPDSSLTSVNTEFKGYFNDPALATEGFDQYSILHETYALTKLLFFVMTGKTNVSGISDKKLSEFVKKGLHADKSKRYQNIQEIVDGFRKYCSN
jgi:tRNA A-37 threonylcarbamoyl transferase component Bud32